MTFVCIARGCSTGLLRRVLKLDFVTVFPGSLQQRLGRETTILQHKAFMCQVTNFGTPGSFLTKLLFLG